MKTRLRVPGIAALALLAYLLVWYQGVQAQATAGFALLGSVNAPTLTFTDTSCPAGSSCVYEVTAVDAQGQSTPATTSSGATAVTQTPGPNGKIIVSWVAPTSGTAPTSYNVYTTARVPNPPTALAAASN